MKSEKPDFMASCDYKVESANWWGNRWTPGARFLRQQRKREDKLIGFAFGRQCRTKPPCRIRFTRLSPRKLDGDNLQGGFKHIRDAFCAAITKTPMSKCGLADGRGDIKFEYAQETGTFGFRVEVWNAGKVRKTPRRLQA